MFIKPNILHGTLRNVSLILPTGYELFASYKCKNIYLYYELISVYILGDVRSIKFIKNIPLHTVNYISPCTKQFLYQRGTLEIILLYLNLNIVILGGTTFNTSSFGTQWATGNDVRDTDWLCARQVPSCITHRWRASQVYFSRRRRCTACAIDNYC
jgi:hypothetical protein